MNPHDLIFLGFYVLVPHVVGGAESAYHVIELEEESVTSAAPKSPKRPQKECFGLLCIFLFDLTMGVLFRTSSKTKDYILREGLLFRFGNPYSSAFCPTSFYYKRHRT